MGKAQLILLVLFVAGSTILIFSTILKRWRKESATLDLFLKIALLDSKNMQGFIRHSRFKLIAQNLLNFESHVPFAGLKRAKYLKIVKNHVDTHNNEIRKVEFEKCKKLFSDSEGNCLLNDEQIQAVVADEDCNLVIAGAGSGKTTVIAHKVKYLVENGVNINDILLVSFTNDSANDLRERIQSKMGLEVNATTLHSFANRISKKNGAKVKMVADDHVVGEKLFEALVKTLSEKEGARQFFEFYSKYFYDVKPLVYYTDINELRRDLAKVGAKFLKNNDRFEEFKLNRHFVTLKGDKVRSIDERYIADFFYINGIKYQYEKKYEQAPYAYHPDFYLPDYDMYWEHFGLDKNGKPPAFFKNPEKYLSGIEEKRRLHSKNRTRLIESVSYALNEESSLEYLKGICVKAGIATKDIESMEVHSLISKKFKQLIQVFYARYKLSRKKIEDLRAWSRPFPQYYFFLNFFNTFLKNYENIMDSEGRCDFTDLLINAIDVYKNGDGEIYKYIIVDEFQDTSWVSMELIEAVAAASPDASLFMVGDDWQAIYGFNGSDVTVMRQFKTNNPECEILNLNSNYRSHEDIVSLSKEFIEKNESQWKKSVQSLNRKHNQSTFGLIKYPEILEKIVAIGKEESVFILGRYNDDCPKDLIKVLHKNGYKNVEYKTIHKSKGLEAEHVFILFPTESWREFPSIFQDHYLLDVLKSSQEDYPFAEERRLFYVAMTRAERTLYLVSPFDNKDADSVFWSEFAEMLNKKVS